MSHHGNNQTPNGQNFLFNSRSSLNDIFAIFSHNNGVLTIIKRHVFINQCGNYLKIIAYD